MSIPFVSIIVPCYNQSHFLSECLDSILFQNFSSWEAIIVNDGSSDDTEAICAFYSSKDSRFRYISQINQGLSSARNSGLYLARGKFLLFLDSDDWLESNCLESFAKLIDSNPGFELYRCGYGYCDKPNGKRFHVHSRPSSFRNTYPDVFTQNIGPCHSILTRRDFAKQIGQFDPSLKSCEDWDFWMRAGRLGARIFTSPDVLVAYRYVPSSMSRNPKVMYEALTEVSRRAGILDPRLPLDAKFNQNLSLDYPEVQKKHLISVLGVLLHQGNVEDAVNWYKAEQQKWNWVMIPSDWKRLSSYLTWAYFLEASEIRQLLHDTLPNVTLFFKHLGYSSREISYFKSLVFSSQLKKRNHFRYGRILGALVNKFTFPLKFNY